MNSCFYILLVLTRPITVFDLLLVGISVLFFVVVGLVALFAAEKLQHMALRIAENAKSQRKWMSLPPELIKSRAYVWNIRIAGLFSIVLGIAELVLVLVAKQVR
jgi:hypothetical protein